MIRQYAGWRFAADAAGCDSMLDLIGALRRTAFPVHRTLSITDPRPVGADRIYGPHELKIVFPQKLRLGFDPSAAADRSDIAERDGRLEMALGRRFLDDLAAAIEHVRGGEADFTIQLDSEEGDGMKLVSFWWWPTRR